MLIWDVEVTLRDSSDDEVDFMRVPYKIDKLEEFFKYTRSWFPSRNGNSAYVIVRHRPSATEAKGKLDIRNKWQTWVTFRKESMRAKDAIRAMMGYLERGDG